MILHFLKKDLLLFKRTRQSFVTFFFFAFLLILMTHFCFAGNHSLKLMLASNWLCLVFASVMVLTKSFEGESVSHILPQIRLSGDLALPFYLSKVLFNFAFLLVLLACLLVVSAFLYGISFEFNIIPFVPLLLGCAGLSVVGTLFSALLLYEKGSELIVSLVMFPLLIPLVLGVFSGYEFSADGLLLGVNEAWLYLIGGYDIVFLLAACLVVDFIFEE